MGAMRPIVTDFSMGELSPRLAGRVDLPLYSKGATEMTNVLPYPLGGAGKRGGLEFKKLIDATGLGSCRMIPWSISNDVDILLLLFNGYIKMLNVSGGASPTFLVDSSAADIQIIYSGTSEILSEIKYAQNRNQIVLVHNSFKPFFIKLDIGTSSGATTFAVSYGDISFNGNIAATQLVLEEIGVYKPMSFNDIFAAIEPKVSTTINSTETKTYTSSDGLNAKFMIGTTLYDITSIVASRTTIEPKLSISGVIKDQYSAGNTNDAFPISPKRVGSRIQHKQSLALNTILLVTEDYYKLDDYVGDLPDGISWLAALQWFDSHVPHGTEWVVCNTSPEWVTSQGNATYGFAYYNGSRTFSVTFNFSSHSSITINSGDSGTFTGYIIVTNENLSINGFSESMIDMVDRLSPWMVEGKTYKCDPTMALTGKRPLWAVKKMDLVKKEPVIEITLFSFPVLTTIKLSRNTSAKLTGQVGIILAPFQSPEEYPSVVAFYQGRLCLGGSKAEPNFLFMSKVNDYFNFCYFEELEYIQTAMRAKPWADNNVPEYETRTNTTQQIGAASAILLAIATDENEAIQSLVAQQDLFIGTSTSEFLFSAGLTALNPRVDLVSRYGSANLQARFIKNSIMFVSSSSRRIRAFGDTGYDMMEYSEHIAGSDIISIDFRQAPYNEIIAVLQDGTAILGRLNDTGVAWCRINTRSGDIIESVVTIRASDEDAVYFMVKRNIGGRLCRNIERMKTTDDASFSGRFYLDCATLVSAGSSFLAVQFNGNTIAIRFLRTSDGREYTGTAVATLGAITTYIDSVTGQSTAIPAFTNLIYGLPFTAALETFRMDTPETEGLQKLAGALFFRCYKTGPFDLVNNRTHTVNRQKISPPDFQGVVQFPYTGTIRCENFSPWDTDQSIRLESNTSDPLGIQVILPQFETGDSI